MHVVISLVFVSSTSVRLIRDLLLVGAAAAVTVTLSESLVSFSSVSISPAILSIHLAAFFYYYYYLKISYYP